MGLFDEFLDKPVNAKPFDEFLPDDYKIKRDASIKDIPSDIGTSLAKGVLNLPKAAVGLADVPAGLLGFDHPFDKAADAVSQAVGISPSQYADQLKYSPRTELALQETNKAWNDPNATPADIAKAYLGNPQAIGATIGESLPGMFAGGAVANKVAPMLSGAARAGLSEGLVMEGQAMSNMAGEGGDPQKEALASLGIGLGGGVIGAKSGALSQRLGLLDPDSLVTSGIPVGQAAKNLPLRMLGGAVQEGALEEAPQSALETGLQNWAGDKPLTQDMARNVVEGALAGAAMGGAINAIPYRKQQAEITGQPATDGQPQPVDNPPTQTTAPLVDPQVSQGANQHPVSAAEPNTAIAGGLGQAADQVRRTVLGGVENRQAQQDDNKAENIRNRIIALESILSANGNIDDKNSQAIREKIAELKNIEAQYAARSRKPSDTANQTATTTNPVLGGGESSLDSGAGSVDNGGVVLGAGRNDVTASTQESANPIAGNPLIATQPPVLGQQPQEVIPNERQTATDETTTNEAKPDTKERLLSESSPQLGDSKQLTQEEIDKLLPTHEDSSGNYLWKTSDNTYIDENGDEVVDDGYITPINHPKSSPIKQDTAQQKPNSKTELSQEEIDKYINDYKNSLANNKQSNDTKTDTAVSPAQPTESALPDQDTSGVIATAQQPNPQAEPVSPVTDSLIYSSTGKPFATLQAAKVAAKKQAKSTGKEFEPIEVEAGKFALTEKAAYLGKNSEGQDVFEKADGSRYIENGQFIENEKQRVVPTRNGIQTEAVRDEKFQVVGDTVIAGIAAPREITDVDDNELQNIAKEAKYLKDIAYSTGELVDNDKKAMVKLSRSLAKSGRDNLLMSRFNISLHAAHTINNSLDEYQPNKLRKIDMDDGVNNFPGLRDIIDSSKTKESINTTNAQEPQPDQNQTQLIPEELGLIESNKQAKETKASGDIYESQSIKTIDEVASSKGFKINKNPKTGSVSYTKGNVKVTYQIIGDKGVSHGVSPGRYYIFVDGKVTFGGYMDGYKNPEDVFNKADTYIDAKNKDNLINAAKELGKLEIIPVGDNKPVVSKNTIFTEDAAEKARQLLKSKLGQLNSGIDPEIMQAGITLAGYHVEKGARSFAAYAKAMLDDLGDVVKPYLKSWYMGVKYDPRAANFDGMDSADSVDKADIDALLNESNNAKPSINTGNGNESVNISESGRRKQLQEMDTDGSQEIQGGRRKPLAGDGENTRPENDAGVLEGVTTKNVRDDEKTGDTGEGSLRLRVQDAGTGGEVSDAGDAVLGRELSGEDRLAGNGTGRERGRNSRGGRQLSSGGVGLDNEGLSPVVNPVIESDKGLVDGGSQTKLSNYHIDNPEMLIGGTPKVRFARNKKAIEIFNSLQDEGRNPTPEERDTLASYIGWGSFGQELFQGSWEKPVYRDGWNKENEWLREHLGEKAWKSAQNSIINAHYTDPPTVSAIWKIAQKLGFNGGRVLEPSMGIGNFYGLMPVDLMEKSALTGIELDDMTGGMAKLLYPDVNVQVKGYQDSKTSDGFYDLIVGNWPFAKDGPSDRRYDKLRLSLHDYFFVKALDQVRGGGLVIGITSSGTMDKVGKLARYEMSKKANLIAAFRMPMGAFEKYAGTSVVADILIFQKHGNGVEPQEPDWLDIEPLRDDQGRELFRQDNSPVRVNQYWAKYPENVLGNMTVGHGTTQGRDGMIVERQDNYADVLESLAERLPENILPEANQGKQIKYISNNTNDRQKSVTIGEDGNLYIVDGDRLALLNDVKKYAVKNTKETGARESQLKQLVGIRKAYGNLIDDELKGGKHANNLRKNLKTLYDNFVKDHGALSASFGFKFIASVGDPLSPALAALEKNVGTKSSPKFVPAKILTQSTIKSTKPLVNPSISDAFVLLRNESIQFVDIEKIAVLSKSTVEQVEKNLLDSGAIFKTPAGNYEVRDTYLSGNVRKKLREALVAQEDGQPMQGNIEALKKVLPKETPYFAIEASLGATWIDKSYYKQFIDELVGIADHGSPDVEVIQTPKGWRIKLESWINRSPEANTIWGVSFYPFSKLINAAFNGQAITIKSEDEDGNQFVNEALSKEANEKAEKIREEFKTWVWKSADRRIDIEKAWNEIINAYAEPNYDGSFLSFDGMALQRGESAFSLRQHQVNAIWRGIANGRGLYAHEVGTGKTYTMGGVAIESRRYGIAKKPLIVAHNANSASVASDIKSMYPAANVLYIDNLSPKTIKQRLYQIANDDWDAIVMPHSLLSNLVLSEETLMEIAQRDILALEEEAIESANEDGFDISNILDDPEALAKVRGATTAKELVKQRNAIINNIRKQATLASRPDAITFEKLGIDMLIVDESHVFKKPPISTRRRVKGLNTSASGEGIAMHFLTTYIRKINNGKGVHVFSGTPITNTLNEIYNQMRYVMGDAMDDAGVFEWDAWFNAFASIVSDVELTSTGVYEPVTRLSGFQNVPELRRFAGQYMDIVFADEMPEFVPRETANGKTLHDADLTESEKDELLNGRSENPIGRPYKKIINESSPMSVAQKSIMDELLRLAQIFKNASGKERRELRNHKSNPVLVETAAAQAGFDPRLVEMDLPDDPSYKPNRVVKNVSKHYFEDSRATQVIFMEKGYNDSAERTLYDASGYRRIGADGSSIKAVVPTFNVAKDIVNKLVLQGIPKEEIAVVTGATSKDRRKEIAELMNQSKIRVVIGSTATLGVGVNMQENLRAMHHLDAPWMPGELEQRNGRGHRQGNKWNTVLEYRYLTEGIDGRRWQILSIKQKFITAFFKADEDTRIIEGDAVNVSENESMDDLAESLSVAAGDPRILMREKLKSDVNKLENKQRNHDHGIVDAKDTAKRLSKTNQRLESHAINLSKDAEQVAQEKGKEFSIEVIEKTYTKRDEANIALANASQLAKKDDVIGYYKGFEILASHYANTLELKRNGVYTSSATIESIDANLRAIAKHRDNTIAEIADNVQSIARLTSAAQTPFSQAGMLEKKRALLAQILQDLEQYPMPAPNWLRDGSPVGTDVYLEQSNKVTVTGHRWGNDNWYVLVDDGKNDVQSIPYTQVMDENNTPVYESRPFTLPEIVTNSQPVGVATPSGISAGDQVTDTEGNQFTVDRVIEPTGTGRNNDWMAEVKDSDGNVSLVPSDTLTKAKFSKSPQKTGSTVAKITSLLPHRVKKLMSAGNLEVVQSVSDLPENLKGFTSIQGLYDNKTDKVYLVADMLDENNLASVLNHELFHRALAVDSQLKASLDSFKQKLQIRFNLAARGVGSPMEIKAYKRVMSAETPLSDQLEEFQAYLVSEWNKSPDSFVGALKKIFQDLVAAIKVALLRVGVPIKNLTPADLNAMALQVGAKVNKPLIKPVSRNALASAQAQRFYSALKRAFIAAPDKVFGNPQQIKNWINGNAQKYDVKKDEIYWSGLTDWLDMQTGKVSRDDVLRFMDANGVRVEDVVLGVLDVYPPNTYMHPETGDIDTYEGWESATDDYSEEGGLSIDEQLETLIDVSGEIIEDDEKKTKHNTEQLTLRGGTDYHELVITIPTVEAYNENDDTHFGDVGKGRQIAWIRHNTRTDADGNTGLFLEEVQSQRGADGRTKGFRKTGEKNIWTVNEFRTGAWEVVDRYGNLLMSTSNKLEAEQAAIKANNENRDISRRDKDRGIPPAPFITDSNNKATNAYITLLMKKAVSQAIDDGKKFVAWTTGKQQADRYDLSKQIDTIEYLNNKSGTSTSIRAIKNNRIVFDRANVPMEELPDLVGKDIAEKIANNEGDTNSNGKKELSGLDLSVGGGWTQAMYGNEQGLNAQGKPSLIMLSASELARKFSGETGSVELLIDGEWLSQPALLITPAMREKIVDEGMPLFSKTQPANTKATTIRFSIAAPEDLFSDTAEIPRTTLSDIKKKAVFTADRFRNQFTKAGLGALTQLQLVEIGSEILPTLDNFSKARNQYDVEESRWHKQADEIANRWVDLVPYTGNPLLKATDAAWQQRNKLEQARIAEIMHQMTVSGIDPRVDKRYRNPGKQAKYNKLKSMYQTLLPGTKRLLDDVDSFHQSVANELTETLQGRIDKAEMPTDKKEALKQALADKFSGVTGPYFPLMRFGDYWVNYIEDGERNVQFFESQRERDDLIKQLIKEGKTVSGSGKSLESFSSIDGVDASFVNQVNELIDSLDIEQAGELKDGVFQLYLTSLPELSMRKHFIHRKKTPGWEKDALRSFSKKAFHDGKQLAKLKYAPVLKDVLNEAEEIVKIGNSQDRQFTLQKSIDIANELLDNWTDSNTEDVKEAYERAEDNQALAIMRKFEQYEGSQRLNALLDYRTQKTDLMAKVKDYARLDNVSESAADIVGALRTSYQNMMQSNTHWLTNLINQGVFTFFLGFNPASALINFFQTPGVALPVIAGRHGFVNASKAVADAALVFAKNTHSNGSKGIESGLVNDGEKAMFKALSDNGMFDRTRSHDLAGLSEEGASRGTLHRDVMLASTFMFHATEIANREITALAAYRLEFKRTGSIQQSIDYANRIVQKAHFDYSTANRPDLFQGNAARVFLQFKMYSQGMTYLWGKTFYDAFIAPVSDGERRKEARATLFSLIGVQTAMAGVLGLPIGGLLMAAQALANLGDDDDDPVDIETLIQQSLTRLFGETAGRVIGRGTLSETGIDFHGRLSLSDLWFRDSDKELEGKDAYLALMESILGPSAGIVKNMYVGFDDIANGNPERGIEKILPNFVGDVAKSYRLASEGGATSYSGNMVYETNAYENALQALGFRASGSAIQYAENTAKMNRKLAVDKTKNRLINKLIKAREDKDANAYRDVWSNEVKPFNDKYPQLRIKPMDVNKRIKLKNKAKLKSENGLVVGKKYEFVNDEESVF